ncbi:MAG: tetratricopeptide repeat protein [Candidatus Lokiarchaeota archaeon]|nr:tetratricopeptide repeat protein [Candidatus Lokiarchaeota archaeon]
MNWYKLGETYFKQKKYLKAVKAFRKAYEKSDDDLKFKINSLISVGDSLKFALEFETADKVYHNALKLAKRSNEPEIISTIQERIDFLYVSEEDNNNIGFLIKTFMRMISNLAEKKNWF